MKKVAHTDFKDLYKDLNCKIFGHKFELTKSYETNRKEFCCANCKRQFTTDPYGNVSPLTKKMKRLNEAMELFYLKRLQRSH